MKTLILSSIVFVFSFLYGCAPNSQDLKQHKINCYNEKLKGIMDLAIYKEVMNQFLDTFKILKRDKSNFGLPEIVDLKADEAIFFNTTKTKCLLIVLIRDNYRLIFGSARIIEGNLINKKWVFEVSLEYMYDRDYFIRYSENNFENLSPLARSSVLTEGDVFRKGCEIDDDYWFKKLK